MMTAMTRMIKFEKVNIFIVLILIICLSQNNLLTFGYYNWITGDPVADAYKDGEPDYADGDLEDKLGDSGYYYDLFPEERDGEPDDYEKGIIGWNYDRDPIYKNGNSNNKKGTDYNNPIVDHITNFGKDYGANSSANGTQVFSAGLAGDIVVTGDKIYYRHRDGTFHKAWLKVGEKWYYFDPVDSALVTTALKDIDGIVYYFNNYGQMMTNTVIKIAGYRINIDSNGACKLIN